MKKLIWGTVLVALAAWLLPAAGLFAGWDIWAWRKQLIYFTGLASFLLMTLVMLLAVRPQWLEKPLGGLDKMYRLHKWAGIWSVVLALLHYGIKLAKGPMLTLFGEATGEQRIRTFLEVFRGSAKDLGEWSVWIFAVMILLALWQRLPYHLWRYVHKAMPVFYLIIVYHGIVLTPAQWWLQPGGALILAASIAGSWCALISLTGRIGRTSTHTGHVLAVRQLLTDTLEVVCQLGRNWRHAPGQFAFVTFDRLEGPHPFTIASSDCRDGQVRFAIKGLGNYTEQLVSSIRAGQPVTIEGPYGCFTTPQPEDGQEQIWIAAGIGVTPFIAWLEGLQDSPAATPVASLYYCTKNEQEAVFAARLQQLCERLPGITLHLHFSQRDGYLTAEQLLAGKTAAVKVWFCGPAAFSDSLRHGMEKLGMDLRNFHQELFQLR